MYTLKDIKLPQHILKSTKWREFIPIQSHNEPDDHYYFKVKLGYSLYNYLYYSIDKNMRNPNDKYLNMIKGFNVTFEYEHKNVEVLSRLFDHTEENKYLYCTDIVLELKFNTERNNQIAFIEIDGLIHTKNPEQKHKNRLKYKAIIDYYNSQKVFSSMSYIVFQVDEYEHHQMQHFIDIIIDTLRYNEPKYPKVFLFEI